VHLPDETPTIIIQSPSKSSLAVREDDNGIAASESSPENDYHTPVFYAGGDDQSNLQLSGVGVFSPAVSTPPSPKITRNQLQLDQLRQRSQHETEIES
jgi:hypothetical protein